MSVRETIKEIFDITIDHNKYVAEWRQTKWITASSFLFMVPCIYAYVNNQWFLSAILLLTSLISANFWRNATYSWRRMTDRVFAKITFVIFCKNGLIYIIDWPTYIKGHLWLFAMLYCYYMSNKYCITTHHLWWKYHMLFHLFAMFAQTTVVKGVIHYEAQMR
jgi:hypothetical protein